MVQENSVSTYIPSESAPGKGLAVNVIYPESGRYKDGAPVMVVVPGGHSGSGLTFTTHSAQIGFIEVRFAFPGGGLKAFHSDGSWDGRGKDSQVALRDVILFAAGKHKDVKGRTIRQLVPAPVDTNNVGAVGWENGGNTLMVTMAKYPMDLSSCLQWITFFESPIGALALTGSLGTIKELAHNKHYRSGTAATGRASVDFSNLAFDRESYRDRETREKRGLSAPKGVLYFDENSNGVWEESNEFPLSYATQPGVNKQYYPPEVTTALVKRKLFPPKGWPEAIARLNDCEEFYQERDGALYYSQLAIQYPNLMITVIGTKIDHHQRQPDHPHIALNYNSWLEAKAHWVRLNPDPKYVGFVGDMNPLTFVENKPNSSIDSHIIRKHLEPEGLLPDFVFVQAAAAELADRFKESNHKDSLSTVLNDYMNEEVKKMKAEKLVKKTAQKAQPASKSDELPELE